MNAQIEYSNQERRGTLESVFRMMRLCQPLSIRGVVSSRLSNQVYDRNLEWTEELFGLSYVPLENVKLQLLRGVVSYIMERED